MARATGFVKRKSKFNALMFLDTLLHAASSEHPSLRLSSIEVADKHKIEITKQSIDGRFNSGAVEFMKAILELQINKQVTSILSCDIFNKFNRVRILDSTKYQIDERFKKQFPGSGGSASDAGICHQFEIDIKSGKITCLTINAANQSDSKYAQKNVFDIKEGDMIIRDLGYYSTEVLMKIAKQFAFYLSRLNSTVNVYEEKKSIQEELSFEKVYRYMLDNNLNRLEKKVFVGKKERMSTRLIIELVPDEIYQNRLKEANRLNKSKGYILSEEKKIRMHFNLMITNASVTDLPAEKIYLFYKIRWQIELIFKIWKSTFDLDKTGKMRYERFMCMMYAKLLLITINFELTSNVRNFYYSYSHKLLSYAKCFVTLKDKVEKIRKLFLFKSKALMFEVKSIVKLFEKNHWLEKKNKQDGLEKIIKKMSNDYGIKHEVTI